MRLSSANVLRKRHETLNFFIGIWNLLAANNSGYTTSICLPEKEEIQILEKNIKSY